MPHLDLIRRWEGLRLHAYRDVAGILTIGYGHTGEVHEGQVIDEAEAERLLRIDVGWAEAAIDRLVEVPLNTNQRAALISWVYNVGPTAAAKSTLIRHLNAGLYKAVPGQLGRWIHAGGEKVPGLKNRRADEIALWEQPIAPLGRLRDSRTIWAAIVGVVTTALTWFRDVATDLMGWASSAVSSGYGWQILRLIEQAQPVVILLVLLVVLYARIDDHRNRRR